MANAMKVIKSMKVMRKAAEGKGKAKANGMAVKETTHAKSMRAISITTMMNAKSTRASRNTVTGKCLLPAQLMRQRAGKHVIQVFGANATGKGTRFLYLVEKEKQRLGVEQWVLWRCNTLGSRGQSSRNFGVLFLPTGLLVLGFPSKVGTWSCLDRVPCKATRLALMHEALDDCRVRVILWEGFFGGLPSSWNTTRAMQQEFGECITVSTYVLYYDDIKVFRSRCAERVIPGGIVESNQLSKTQISAMLAATAGKVPRACLKKFQNRKCLEQSSGWRRNKEIANWFFRNNRGEVLSNEHVSERTSSVVDTTGKQSKSTGRSKLLRMSVHASKDFLWKEICE